MAYEISEGSAAAALFIPENELAAGLNSENIVEALGKIHEIIISNKIVMSENERTQYEIWFNPNKLDEEFKKKGKSAKLTAIVHGYSAALAIKEWMRIIHGENSKEITDGNVFVTGASFANPIKHLKVPVGAWKDYNSSDIVIIMGKCYYGISLKKKDKNTSMNPPMINKSLVNLLTELDQKEIANTFLDTRINWFANVIKEAVKTGGPLSDSELGGKSNKDLIETTFWNPYKSEWTPLINIKGVGKKTKITLTKTKTKYGSSDFEYIDGVTGVKDLNDWKSRVEVKKFFGKGYSQSDWTMRKFVNSALGKGQNSAGHLYYNIQKLANNGTLAKEIGLKLIQAVLKTELKTSIEGALGERKQGEHFGFALVTAHGKVTSAESVTWSKASVKDNPVIQQVVADLVKTDNWEIRIDLATTKKKSESAAGVPGKIFFEVGVGQGIKFKSALDIQLRYKGSFTAAPQFIGGMSKKFENLISDLKDKDVYEFGDAC